MSLIYNGSDVTFLPSPALPAGWYKFCTADAAYAYMQGYLRFWRDRMNDPQKSIEATEQYRKSWIEPGNIRQSNILKEEIDKILSEKNQIRIFDFGCASGSVCYFLKENFQDLNKFYYLGYDVNPDMIADAKINFPFFDFETTTGESIPCDPFQPFDLTIFSMSLHTLPNAFAIPWMEFASRNSTTIFIKDAIYELPENLKEIHEKCTDILMQVNSDGFFLFLHNWRMILESAQHRIIRYIPEFEQHEIYQTAIMIVGK